MIESEISPTTVDEDWDVVVIGAGPAGALAACKLSSKLDKILLVEKSSFPRSKVCGCCLNRTSISVLEANSLAHLLTSSGAVPLRDVTLFENGSPASVKLPGGFALSRERLDLELVKSAIERGVFFMPETTAEVGDTTDSARRVQLSSRGVDKTIRAKVVLVADGLNGRSLNRLSEFDCKITKNSRFGCGTIVADGPKYYVAGRIYMACSPHGYVGLVRLEDGRIDIAAALDRHFSRSRGGPAQAAAEILTRNNLPLPPSMSSAHWSGTESLTRTRNLIAAERLFLVGDSCGYAEPFTGEGIAWALTSADAIAKYAEASAREWVPTLSHNWTAEYGQLIHSRQSRSNLIARGLRINTLRNIAMPLISAFPTVASSLVNHITRPVLPSPDAA